MPEETLNALVEWFQDKEIEALGIGCFGPVDLRRSSKTYGCITTTPKPGWAWCDMVGTFRRALGVSVGFDTDVNASVLGEVRFGQGRGLSMGRCIMELCIRKRGMFCFPSILRSIGHAAVLIIPTVWKG